MDGVNELAATLEPQCECDQCQICREMSRVRCICLQFLTNFSLGSAVHGNDVGDVGCRLQLLFSSSCVAQLCSLPSRPSQKCFFSEEVPASCAEGAAAPVVRSTEALTVTTRLKDVCAKRNVSWSSEPFWQPHVFVRCAFVNKKQY